MDSFSSVVNFKNLIFSMEKPSSKINRNLVSNQVKNHIFVNVVACRLCIIILNARAYQTYSQKKRKLNRYTYSILLKVIM